MAELTRRATTLIKEMITADGKLPAYDVSIQVIRDCLEHWTVINGVLLCRKRW